IVRSRDRHNLNMTDGHRVAGNEILKSRRTDFAQPVAHDVVGVACAKDWNLQLAMKNARAGGVVRVVMGNEKPVKRSAINAPVGHAITGAPEGYARIKQQPYVAGFIIVAVSATARL